MQSSVTERLNWTPSGEQLRGGRDTTLEATRRGQQEGQATGGGFESGRADVAGNVFKKTVQPEGRWEFVWRLYEK